ncbi:MULTISPECIES: hypothetical protein [Empedobacter]|uniref:Carboxypeptidase-like regulatory domain-containing protein n=1 Tax=Empedobacter falsenii TaxID=343874 RepID=A0A3R8Z9U5_9FLAO|nr:MULTISPECIES: hypothetical protein [Empedobacter]MDH0673372.1 hypothetical protein [Empedobacter sp. GD03861]RRT93437.1 hypothetical protein EGI89_03270 [Empedobacter falsenii]RRT93583.1 hypothetical protein EGI88_03280 [Empedobacter falsenii]HBX62539.1 hypothetical protein [Flavobacteriaceae bacterium]
MNKILHVIIFGLMSTFSFAQTTLITGKVVIDDGVVGQDAVDHILIMNEMTNARVLTNENGMFSIKASVGDELVIAHDFYIERKIKITSDILAKGMLTIHLNIETIELAEARINTLDKNFKNNIKLEHGKVDELYDNLNLGFDPNLRFRKINPNMTSTINNNGLLDPSNWIATISGQKKKDKKQNEYFKKVDKIIDLENYFTINYFIETLNIPENKVTDYVRYCYANFELEKLVKENKYDKITEILEEQAPKYLEMIKK